MLLIRLASSSSMVPVPPHGIRDLIPYDNAIWQGWSVLAAVVAILLCGTAFFIFRSRRRRAKSAEILDPFAIVLTRLTSLRPCEPFSQPAREDFFYHLSFLLREAIELVATVPATDLTVGEMDRLGRDKIPLPTEEIDRVFRFFNRADMIKFAASPADVDEARNYQDAVIRWAERMRCVATRPDAARGIHEESAAGGK